MLGLKLNHVSKRGHSMSMLTTKKTQKLCVTGPGWGNLLVTFTRASNGESISMSWCHHATTKKTTKHELSVHNSRDILHSLSRGYLVHSCLMFHMEDIFAASPSAPIPCVYPPLGSLHCTPKACALFTWVIIYLCFVIVFMFTLVWCCYWPPG